MQDGRVPGEKKTPRIIEIGEEEGEGEEGTSWCNAAQWCRAVQADCGEEEEDEGGLGGKALEEMPVQLDMVVLEERPMVLEERSMELDMVALEERSVELDMVALEESSEEEGRGSAMEFMGTWGSYSGLVRSCGGEVVTGGEAEERGLPGSDEEEEEVRYGPNLVEEKMEKGGALTFLSEAVLSVARLMVGEEGEGGEADTDPETMVEGLRELVALVGLTEDEMGRMEEVMEGLEAALRGEFPSASLQPYGSSATGLGVHGVSDLDLLVTLDTPVHLAEGRWVTRRMARLLRAHPSKRFRSALAIMANTPIVRVTDILTGVRCDLNATNRMGVENSRFLRHCTEADTRVRELMMVVKVFARIHRITDSSAGGHLNNYSLACMVVHYLQTQDLLHPLHNFQRVPGLQERIIGGYNFAFCQESGLLPPLPSNSSSLLHLLEGFMDYYAFFPYTTHAVCPAAGREVALTDLAAATNLPSCLRGVSGVPDRFGALVILDPFEVRRNVAHAVSAACLDAMVEAFQLGLEVLGEALEGRESQAMLLEMLFQPGFLAFTDIFPSMEDVRSPLQPDQVQEGGEGGGEGGSVVLGGDEERGAEVVGEGGEELRDGEEISVAVKSDPAEEGEEDSDVEMFSVMSQVLLTRKSTV